jgi:hypothetical protein
VTETAAWHVDPFVLREWVDGTAGSLVSVSVEQHVQRCPRCRAEVANIVAAPPLEQAWQGVLAAVEKPAPSLVERTLLRAGMKSSDVLVIGSAVTLRFAWLASVAVVLGFAEAAQVFAADNAVGLFLAAAPLLPVLAVALVYGPSVDPVYELVQATPYAMVRLVLLRAAAAIVTSVPFAVPVGLLMPAPWYLAVAWLLPAAGCIAVVLTASLWIDPAYATVVVAVGWLVAVTLAVRYGDPLAVLAPQALLAYAGVAIVAGLVLRRRLVSSTPSWRLR